MEVLLLLFFFLGGGGECVEQRGGGRREFAKCSLKKIYIKIFCFMVFS